jgi:porphobilinogen synthase
VALDIAEVAGIVTVKTALPYLDILFRVKERLGAPALADQVSGEYAIIMVAAAREFLDGDKAMLKSLFSLKRAGAACAASSCGDHIVKC